MWNLVSLIRNRTQVPCIERWSLNHWTTREVPTHGHFNMKCIQTPFTLTLISSLSPLNIPNNSNSCDYKSLHFAWSLYPHHSHHNPPSLIFLHPFPLSAPPYSLDTY